MLLTSRLSPLGFAMFLGSSSAILAVLGVTTLAACASKTDANEKNFSAAITQYFERHGNLCLGLGQWPVIIGHDVKDLKMPALESAGLVKGEIDDRGPGSYKIKRYTLTDAAKPFVHEWVSDGPFMSGVKLLDLCWGKKALDRIVKWKGPMKFGDYQEAGVIFTYKVNNVADWATKPGFQLAFPDVKRVLDGVGTKQEERGVKLTNQGWEPADAH